MKMLKFVVLLMVVLFAAQIKLFAASNDLWCVGSVTKGECVNSGGSIIPMVDGTHNLGSAAKSFGSAWIDGTLTVQNVIVTGTLSPYTTGSFTAETIAADRATLTYGVAAATGVFSGAVTASTFGGNGAALTALAPANIAAGTMIVGVGPFQAADCEVLTPAAVGKWCFSTGTNILNISTSANVGGFAPLH